MAKGSGIEWTDHTWTLVVGCDAVSPACAKCYAALMAVRLEAMGQAKYQGLATRVGNVGKWTGEVRFDEAVLDLPLRTKKPARWFLTSMGDIAHEKVTDGQLLQAFVTMRAADWHTFLVLTKRVARLAAFLGRSPLPNVFIGCTAENQAQADAHRPHMAALAARGWRTFVSYEPALGPVDWSGWEFLQQIISGGESGHGARPAHPDWHREARDYAAKHGIAYLFKQHGSWAPGSGDFGAGRYRTAAVAHDGRVAPGGFDRAGYPAGASSADGWAMVHLLGKAAAGRLLDGVEHNGSPA